MSVVVAVACVIAFAYLAGSIDREMREDER